MRRMILSAVIFAGLMASAQVWADSSVPKNLGPYDRVLYEYNAQGQMIKKTVLYDQEYKLSKYSTYEYDTAGRLFKENKYKDDKLDDYIFYEYDSQNRLVKETEYGAKGKVKNFKEYEYMADGTVVKRFINGDGGRCYRYSVKKYDAAGNLLEDSDYRE